MDTQRNETNNPPYGRRLLPCVLDEEAKSNPQRTFAAIPRSEDVSEGFQDVTFAQVANAVNYVANRLHAWFGSKLKHDFETLTYIGVPDLRYNVVFYAAVKCGYKVFFPSPRNPPATNLLLMEQTYSTKILYAKEMALVVKQLSASKVDLTIADIDPLAELLRCPGSEFPYHISFDEAIGQPILVLHSSGSTGIPKPVVMSHGTFAAMDNDRNFPGVSGRKTHDLTIWDFDGTEGRIYEPFPPFHLAGFFNKIMIPLFTNAIPVFGPSLRPPTGALAAEIMRQQRIRGCLLPPSVAEQLLHEQDGLDIIKSLDVLCYAGGPLSLAAGDTISKVTTLCQFYGSTELGQVRQLVPRPEDWSYMEFHPYAKLGFQPSEDGAYELVIFADATTEQNSALNHNYPGLDLWRTKDLFKPHPSKQGLWRFHGRVDDILVLSSGEKLNPVPMESHLQRLPELSGALIVGQGRFQPALLLEANNARDESGESLVNEIWPAIVAGNTNMPAHGQIVRSMIMVAKAQKPFFRAGKGTIVRRLAEAAYADEIEELYTVKANKSLPRPRGFRPTEFALDSVNSLIRSILSAFLEVDKIEGSDNLYLAGLDSIKTIEVLEDLKSSLQPYSRDLDLSWLSAETIYENPSTQQLSRVLLAFLNKGEKLAKGDRVVKMSEMLESFVQNLGSLPVQPVVPRKAGQLKIALTGTTGTLGQYLLEEYTRNPSVSRVLCLNRSRTAQQQWEEHVASGADTSSKQTAKLHFTTVNFAQANLGLGPSEYTDIMEGCDLIVHTAWKVDFNQDLSSFIDNIQSVRTLINWSISSPRHPRIVFVSSISSVGPWNPVYQNKEIPEAPIEDLNAALPFGYSESKQVAERLLDRAANVVGIPICILRVGQIGGPSNLTQAKWTERELVPSMLRTSRSIGLLPSELPPVDWIPVDVVSKIVVEISLNEINDVSLNPRYHNLVNPTPVPWQEFLDVVRSYCGTHIQAVPLSQWVEKLDTFHTRDTEQLASKPVLKMLKFFSYMSSRGPTVKYETKRAVQASETMAGLKPVSQDLMKIWLAQSA